MKKTKGKSIDMDVEYYILKFEGGEPMRETTKKSFTIMEGERSEIPCPYCGKHIGIRAKTKA
jgi:hypothetical protein